MSFPNHPYPLAWPDGWIRTPAHKRTSSRFKTGFVTARNKVLSEIRLLGGRGVVITSMLPVRNDGLPYANGRAVDGDPGIAVYWWEFEKGMRTGKLERVMACDRWRRPEDNLHAAALTIGALRGISRWGTSSIVDKAFSGFAALPPNPEIDWRAELELSPHASGLEMARANYRVLAAKHHPDRGGDAEKMSRINRAWEAAQRELAR